MCSRTEATLRLIAAWLGRAVDDPDFPYRVSLADMLTEDSIAIVSEMDLLTEYSEESAKRRLPRSTRKQFATKQCCALGLYQNRRVRCRSVADLMRWMWLLIGAIALIAWVTTPPFRRVRGAPRQMIITFAESAKKFGRTLTRRRSWRACRTLPLAANLASP